MENPFVAFQYQITTLCMSISLSATVAVVCLYGPKCYIIIFHPDKNVRKLTMNSAAYKKHLPGPSSTGGTNIVQDSESPAHGGKYIYPHPIYHPFFQNKTNKKRLSIIFKTQSGVRI